MSRARKPAPAAAVDAALSSYWQQTIAARRAFEIGLLIGQVGGSPVDALLTAVRVPSESEDGEAARAFEDVSVDWVQEFAKQIDRLLPGGISIAGLYVVSPLAARVVFDEASLYLRAIAEMLQWPEEFGSLANAPSSTSVHYVVHVCPNSSKTSAQSLLDVLDASKTIVAPTELKTGAALELHQFTATVAVDEPIAFARELLLTTQGGSDCAERIMHAFQKQLVPLAARVFGAVAVPTRRDAASSNRELQFLAPASAPAVAASSSSERAGIEEEHNGVRETAAAALQLKHDFLKTLLLRAELVVERWTATDGDDSSGSGVSRERSVFSRSGGDVVFPARTSLPWTSALGNCHHFPALLHVFHGEHDLAVQSALEMLGSLDCGGDTNSGDDASATAAVATATASLVFLESETPAPSERSSSGKTSVTTSVTTKSVSAAAAASVGTSSSSLPNIAVLLAVLLVLLAVLAQVLLRN